MNQQYVNPFSILSQAEDVYGDVDDVSSEGEVQLDNEHELPTVVHVYRRSNCICTDDSDGDDAACSHVVHTSCHAFYKNAHLAWMLDMLACDNENLTIDEQRDLFCLLHGETLGQYLKQQSIKSISPVQSKKRATKKKKATETARGTVHWKARDVSDWEREQGRLAYQAACAHYHALMRQRDDDCFLSEKDAHALGLYPNGRIAHSYTVHCINSDVFVV